MIFGWLDFAISLPCSGNIFFLFAILFFQDGHGQRARRVPALFCEDAPH